MMLTRLCGRYLKEGGIAGRGQNVSSEGSPEETGEEAVYEEYQGEGNRGAHLL